MAVTAAVTPVFGPLGVTGGYRLQRDVQYTYFWYTSTRKVPKFRFEAKKVKIGLFGPFWNVRGAIYTHMCGGSTYFGTLIARLKRVFHYRSPSLDMLSGSGRPIQRANKKNITKNRQDGFFFWGADIYYKLTVLI